MKPKEIVSLLLCFFAVSLIQGCGSLPPPSYTRAPSLATPALANNGVPRIDFVYFCATACPDCVRWEARDLPALRASGAFQGVRLTKVFKYIEQPIPPRSWFPDEVKYLRDPIARATEGKGAPVFAVLVDGKVVATWSGAKKTPDEIFAVLREQEENLLEKGA